MTVLVADDDKLVCSSLKTILESRADIHVCAAANSASEAAQAYRQHRPDIALLDIRMNGSSGIDAAQEILAFDSSAKILFLTTFSDDEYIVKALSIGAKGYLLKQDYESIFPALTAVAAGQSVFGSAVMTKIPALMGSSTEPFDWRSLGLTEREYEITALVAEGQSNKEIADTLFLSEGTVRNYLSIILEKLNLRDRTQLAVFYYKHRGM